MATSGWMMPATRRIQQLLSIAAMVSFVALPQSADCHRGHGDHERQHQPPSSAKHRGTDQDTASSFHDSKIVHDADHINEHLQGKASVNVSEMSMEELEFHYFKMHDFDNNTKLDGLEILKALTHLLPYDHVEDEEKAKINTHGKTTEQIQKERKEKELSYYTEIVDNVLADDDIDDDGYLTYPEYILARRREEATEKMVEATATTGSH